MWDEDVIGKVCRLSRKASTKHTPNRTLHLVLTKSKLCTVVSKTRCLRVWHDGGGTSAHGAPVRQIKTIHCAEAGGSDVVRGVVKMM